MGDLFDQSSGASDFDKIYTAGGTSRHRRGSSKTAGTSREYFWIVTLYGDRLAVIGPKDYESEAQDFAYQKLTTPFVIVPLKTRDRSKATSQIKAMKLDELGDLGVALQKASHQTPTERQFSNQNRIAPNQPRQDDQNQIYVQDDNQW